MENQFRVVTDFLSRFHDDYISHKHFLCYQLGYARKRRNGTMQMIDNVSQKKIENLKPEKKLFQRMINSFWLKRKF